MAKANNKQFEKVERLIERARISAARVLIMGLGTMGATLALILTTHGLGSGRRGHVTLIDNDVTEERNLVGTPYLFEHVGQSKVDALADVLQRKSPNINLSTWNRRITASDKAEIMDRANESDLIVWALEPTAEILDIADATSSVVPQLMATFGEQCDFAEVAFSVPGQTQSIVETMGRRARTPIDHPQALGCDTDFVASFVASICLQLLHGNRPSDALPILYANAPLFVVGLRHVWIFESMPPDQLRSIYMVGTGPGPNVQH